MRKIFDQLNLFLRSDFHLGSYLLTAAFLGICIFLNYHFKFTITYIYRRPQDGYQLLSWIGFLGIPYLVVLGIRAVMEGKTEALRKPGFWGMTAFAILLIAIPIWFPYHKALSESIFPIELKNFGRSLLWNMKRLVLLLPVLWLWWRIVERGEGNFYGLWTRPRNLGPYLALLAMVLPAIIWASFQPDFQRTYPQYVPGTGEERLGISPWATGLAFEAVYGLDFAWVELFFRGFLVIGMARWLGRGAVLPMVAMYCFLHFAKPMGETVGSVLGGFLLGVVAYESRSVWGGVLAHAGLAWLMEAAAYGQRLLH